MPRGFAGGADFGGAGLMITFDVRAAIDMPSH
jgi:hypothetical protein